ncbi:ribosomal protein L28e [Exophiala aquamarina CBS 119918]|uniref:Ribosomal protein L28e n=1 Tax=Exophiala aquamarina CBS 119918 TaxID=1182545 RepID=A0A072PPC4_9EURO|nr:ribosomal protein L28e [Exophiala aquamarina CBS 119918]KEF61597.1 ribosomal protein L28e [Exophiala aquamarina CBS 119918]
MSAPSNVSGDLIWEVVRNNNAFIVKRNSGGGVQFSRDPFNLTNKHSRKHAGFVNNKAVSIQANEKGGVTLQTKKSGSSNKPASQYNSHAFGKTTSNRKIYKSVADAVGKRSYRGDLNKDAVARASAIRDSQRVKKDTPARKPRGAKASKTEA